MSALGLCPHCQQHIDVGAAVCPLCSMAITPAQQAQARGDRGEGGAVAADIYGAPPTDLYDISLNPGDDEVTTSEGEALAVSAHDLSPNPTFGDVGPIPAPHYGMPPHALPAYGLPPTSPRSPIFWVMSLGAAAVAALLWWWLR